LAREGVDYEWATTNSLEGFLGIDRGLASFLSNAAGLASSIFTITPPPKAAGDGLLVFRRDRSAKGPMSVFGYDYFTDKYGEEKTRGLKLLRFEGLRASGGEYAYEVLNFVDGVRNAQQIRDAVSAEYGPIPLEYVIEYLQALESIGVIQRAKM
jgi:hypothetical protein